MYSLLYSLLFLHVALAEVVRYRWDISWVRGNPDGVERPVIGINGKWPCPPIEASVGDRVIIDVTNSLGNESTGIHFHGLFQRNTNAMDGPTGVTQCPIPPGSKFTYDFNIEQAGTYWYHSHNKGQYPDGLRGPIIIEDPKSPYRRDYDEELVLTLSDWYHDQMPGLINFYVSKALNGKGAEPIPKSALMNDAQNIKFHIKSGKKYLVRIINMAAFAAQHIHFDEHTMTIVEIDGVYTQKQKADTILIAAAQRYSVIIEAKPNAKKNFAFLGAFDVDMFDNQPADLKPNVTGYLVYDDKLPLPSAPPTIAPNSEYDDFLLLPHDGQKLLGPVDRTVTLNLDFTVIDGSNRATFNKVTYLEQKVPSLFTALTTGQSATNPLVYGPNANAFVTKPNEIVEIVVNNYDSGGHPMHLHGHNFQVIARSAENVGPYPGQKGGFPAKPMRRDVVKVDAGGYVVMRYKADNPGVWLFHCHIEWHVEAGLTATFVESPLLIQKQDVPDQHLQVCKKQGIKTAGNAAGNTKDFLDLRGANTVIPSKPNGALV